MPPIIAYVNYENRQVQGKNSLHSQEIDVHRRKEEEREREREREEGEKIMNISSYTL